MNTGIEERRSFRSGFKKENQLVSMSGFYDGLPKEKVLKIFSEVWKIRKATGFGQREITWAINKKFQVDFKECTVSGWLYRGIVPFANEKTQFKPIPKPPKKKILDLYKKGFSSSEIGAIFGVTFWTAREWLRFYGVKPRTHLESMNTVKIKDILRQQKIVVPRKGLNEMSAEKAYVFGVLCGDAYIDKDMVKLEIRHDTEFIQRFTDSMNKIYGTDYNYRYYPLRNSLIIDISRQSICQDLLKNNSFRTFTWRVPKEILCAQNKEYIINFLQGFFDSEGHVGDYLVDASSRNLEGLLQVQELLGGFNISSRLYGDNVRLIISKKENIKRFKETINFTIKRKAEKLAGFYKGKW